MVLRKEPQPLSPPVMKSHQSLLLKVFPEPVPFPSIPVTDTLIRALIISLWTTARLPKCSLCAEIPTPVYPARLTASGQQLTSPSSDIMRHHGPLIDKDKVAEKEG